MARQQDLLRDIFGTTDPAELRAIANKAKQFDELNRPNARNAGRKKRFTKADVCCMLAAQHDGKTLEEIAQAYGTTRQTINTYFKEIKNFAAPKDVMLRLYYMHRHTLCTVIDVDFKHEKIYIKNYTDIIILRAFGILENPTWEDFDYFLRDHCFPEDRAFKKLILKEIGLDFYDPLLIIEKTLGRMAENHQWIMPIYRQQSKVVN